MSNRLPDQKGEADGSESTRHKAENYKEQQRTTKNQAKELKNSTIECQGIRACKTPLTSKQDPGAFFSCGYPTSAPITILDPLKGLAGGKWEEQAE
jgi:hypothetical protein